MDKYELYYDVYSGKCLRMTENQLYSLKQQIEERQILRISKWFEALGLPKFGMIDFNLEEQPFNGKLELVKLEPMYNGQPLDECPRALLTFTISPKEEK